MVRFTVSSPAAADSVRRLGIDIVEVHPRATHQVELVAVVSARDRSMLGAHGWQTIDVARSPEALALEPRRIAMGARAFQVYRDFDDPSRGIAAWMRAFAASHTNVFVDSIGASGEGRPILAAKVGTPADDPSLPDVLFLGTYHAREWAATEMARRLLVWLADSLPQQPGGAALLASRDVWVIPVVNPDGYQFTFTGDRFWRKNRRVNGDGSFGVDLNRNHSGFWGFDDNGSSATPASEVYRGPSVASEPEVKAIEAFNRAHQPAAAITYHTYTGVVLYPWSHVNGARTGDDAVFRALAGTDVAPSIPDIIPASINSYYHPGPGWELYPINGDYTTYAYRAFHTAAFTVELTSGCCYQGKPYGFDFPDDDALLAQLAHDNYPFALKLLTEAANLTRSALFPAAGGATAQFESIWPELRVLLDAPAGQTANEPVDIAVDSGVIGFRFAPRDTLGVGRRFVRKIGTDPLFKDLRGVRLPVDGLSAEILLREGAEQPSSGWHGFKRLTGAYEGSYYWQGYTDTLVSPPIPMGGRSGLTLFFWTRHAGSLFDQSSRGLVQTSTDNGASWSTVAEVVGAAPEWYPVATPLTPLPTATALRIRFLAEAFDWSIDAVSLAASDTLVPRLFNARSAQAPGIETSANPVRGTSVTLRWAAGTGNSRVEIFSVMGTRVNAAILSPDPGRWVWDLTTERGQAAANGGYYIVVTLGDGTRLRRRLLVAR
jgi:hypothetical protein